MVSEIARHPDSARGKVVAREQALLCCFMGGEAAIFELEKLWILVSFLACLL